MTTAANPIPVYTETDAKRDGGSRGNSTADAAINDEIFARFFSIESTDPGPRTLPGRQYLAISTPIPFATVNGQQLVGGGINHGELTQANWNLAGDEDGHIGTNSCLVYVNGDEPAGKNRSLARLPGVSTRIERITFQGRPITAPDTYTGERASYGIVVENTGVAGLPPSLHHFTDVAFNQCDVAFHVSATPVENNCDFFVFTGITYIVNCPIGFQCENSQGVNYLFDIIKYINFVEEDGKYVLDMQAGGRVTAHQIEIEGNDITVIRTGIHDLYTGRFDLGIYIDGSATGWKLLEMSQASRVVARLDGTLVENGYDRPIVLPKGNLYSIELDFAGLYQTDIDAWPRGGIRSNDSCLSFLPAGTNLQAWFDLADPLTITSPTDASLVTNVADKASSPHAAQNSLTQATLGSRPVYDADGIHNRPCLYFDGKYIEKSTPINVGSAATALEIHGVARTSVVTAGTDPTIISLNKITTNRCWRIWLDDDYHVKFNVSKDGGAGTTVTSSNAVVDKQQFYFRASYDGSTGNMTLEVNGIETLGNVSGGGALFTATGVNLVMGAHYFNTSPTNNFRGWIGEIQIFNAVLSSFDRDFCRDNAAGKWGCPIAITAP